MGKKMADKGKKAVHKRMPQKLKGKDMPETSKGKGICGNSKEAMGQTIRHKGKLWARAQQAMGKTLAHKGKSTEAMGKTIAHKGKSDPVKSEKRDSESEEEDWKAPTKSRNGPRVLAKISALKAATAALRPAGPMTQKEMSDKEEFDNHPCRRVVNACSEERLAIHEEIWEEDHLAASWAQ